MFPRIKRAGLIKDLKMESKSFSAARAGRIFLALALIGGAGCIYVSFRESEQFAFSYLTAFALFVCVALGGLLFVLIHHLTRAGWSVVVRRIAEHIMANLQWMVLLILP